MERESSRENNCWKHSTRWELGLTDTKNPRCFTEHTQDPDPRVRACRRQGHGARMWMLPWDVQDSQHRERSWWPCSRARGRRSVRRKSQKDSLGSMACVLERSMLGDLHGDTLDWVHSFICSPLAVFVKYLGACLMDIFRPKLKRQPWFWCLDSTEELMVYWSKLWVWWVAGCGKCRGLPLRTFPAAQWLTLCTSNVGSWLGVKIPPVLAWLKINKLKNNRASFGTGHCFSLQPELQVGFFIFIFFSGILY